MDINCCQFLLEVPCVHHTCSECACVIIGRSTADLLHLQGELEGIKSQQHGEGW